MRLPLDTFEEISLVDFEFNGKDGDRPNVISVAFHELRSGRKGSIWHTELGAVPPFRTDSRTLYVAYNAAAELTCHLALGWPLPTNILDLYIEYRALRNHCGDIQEPAKFVDALDHFHIDNVGILTKEHWYEVILRGAPFTPEEITGILEYGWSDVDRLLPLLEAIPIPNLQQALVRGSSTRAEAIMRHAGIPIDHPLFLDMQGGWQDIRRGLVDDLNTRVPVFEGATLKLAKLEQWATDTGIKYWERTPTGKLSTEAKVLEGIALKYPHAAEFCNTKILLAQLKTFDLAVGSDGRNRVMLSPVRSKTSRYQPSNSQFIFGLHAGLRSLIKPDPGMAVAHLDFSGQEFAIAAYLSGDANMIIAYESGDPYSWWARAVGAMPPGGTKRSHPIIRATYKRAALGISYGMQAETLAEYVGVSILEAKIILRGHYELFPQFWRWSAAVYNDGIATRALTTAFGWPMRIRKDAGKLTMINFPMQGNGADMLRLALCFAVDRNIPIIAPIHDAIMVEGPIGDIVDIAHAMKRCMVEASRAVLGGPAVRVDINDYRYPARYADTRDGAQELWAKVTGLLPAWVKSEVA